MGAGGRSGRRTSIQVLRLERDARRDLWLTARLRLFYTTTYYKQLGSQKSETEKREKKERKTEITRSPTEQRAHPIRSPPSHAGSLHLKPIPSRRWPDLKYQLLSCSLHTKLLFARAACTPARYTDGPDSTGRGETECGWMGRR